jgi:hypothetical protein
MSLVENQEVRVTGEPPEVTQEIARDRVLARLRAEGAEHRERDRDRMGDDLLEKVLVEQQERRIDLVGLGIVPPEKVPLDGMNPPALVEGGESARRGSAEVSPEVWPRQEKVTLTSRWSWSRN